MDWARKRPALALALIGILGLTFASRAAHAQGAAFTDSKGVSDKPQSKVWSDGANWWACLDNLTKVSLYKNVGGTWTKKLDLQNAVIPFEKGGTCDVLRDGPTLFIAIYDAISSKIYKLNYNSITDNYQLATGFPVSIAMRPGSETIVLDKDSTGRLWLTYEAEQKIYVQWTTSADHKTWVAAPLEIGNGVDPDDISAIVAFGTNVGVVWTDQLGQRVCFRTHKDVDLPTVWQSLEIVRSGFGCVDDHINMKADAHGRVYFAAKDWFDGVWVGRREANGAWAVTTGASGLDCGTRPILQIDEAQNKLYVFYTRWETCVSTGNHAIEERVARLDANLLFSLPTVVIAATGVAMNDASGSKAPLPTGSMAILCAGGTTKAYWRGWGPVSGLGGSDPGGAFPPPPTSPPTVTAADVTESPASRLLLCRFDEMAGTTASDASGNGGTMTFGTGISVPHWAPGVRNGGLFFDGDDYLIHDNGAAFDFNGSSFTLEAWIKRDLTNGPGTGVIIGRADTLHTDFDFTLTGNVLEFGWSVNDSIDTSVKATASLSDLGWHHVAAVWDASLSEARLFVDGKRAVSKIMLPSGFIGNYPLTMGAIVQGPVINKQFAGFLDNAAIAGNALYNSDFVPPVLYPAAPQRYARVTWGAASSQAGISGYHVARGINLKARTDLTTTPTANTFYLDLAPADGILEYAIRAVDGLTQQGASSSGQLRYESTPPAVPTAPLGMDWVAGTASLDGPAFWEFDDTGGVVTKDGTDFGHDARLGALGAGDAAEPTWVNTFSGTGLSFDGGDYLEAGDAPDLDIPGSFTVEVWIQRSTLGGTQCLLAKDQSTSKRNYAISLTSAGLIEFSWSKSSGTQRKVTSTTGITDITTWHHIACVNNAATTTNTIYLDGVAVGSAALAGPAYTGTEPVLIGARSPGSLTNFFKGRIDLVRISNTVKYTGAFTPPQFYRGGPRRAVVKLSWGLPNNGLVLNYRLYRQQLPSGTNTLLGTIPADVAYFADAFATSGITYRYTAKAMNSANVEGVASAPCDILIPSATDVQSDPPPFAGGKRLRIEPNPFNPQATVRFSLDHAGPVRVELFDARGRRLDTLFQGVLPAGEHEIRLLRPDGATRNLSSGTYFVRMEADGRISHTKAVLLK